MLPFQNLEFFRPNLRCYNIKSLLKWFPIGLTTLEQFNFFGHPVIMCHHMSSHVITCHHMSSHVILSSHVITCHHMSSHVITCNHVSSCVVTCHHPWIFWKQDFELWVVGDDQDMYQHIWGDFWSMRPLLSMWSLGAKKSKKIQTLKKEDRA